MARMTRQYFKQIAESLAEIPNTKKREAEIDRWLGRLSASNPLFDEARFRAYVEKMRRERASRGDFGDRRSKAQRAASHRKPAHKRAKRTRWGSNMRDPKTGRFA